MDPLTEFFSSPSFAYWPRPASPAAAPPSAELIHDMPDPYHPLPVAAEQPRPVYYEMEPALLPAASASFEEEMLCQLPPILPEITDPFPEVAAEPSYNPYQNRFPTVVRETRAKHSCDDECGGAACDGCTNHWSVNCLSAPSPKAEIIKRIVTKIRAKTWIPSEGPIKSWPAAGLAFVGPDKWCEATFCYLD